MQEFVNFERILSKNNILVKLIGKPFEKKGRKTKGLRTILVYDCLVALKYDKCNQVIFYKIYNVTVMIVTIHEDETNNRSQAESIF